MPDDVWEDPQRYWGADGVAADAVDSDLVPAVAVCVDAEVSGAKVVLCGGEFTGRHATIVSIVVVNTAISHPHFSVKLDGSDVLLICSERDFERNTLDSNKVLLSDKRVIVPVDRARPGSRFIFKYGQSEKLFTCATQKITLREVTAIPVPPYDLRDFPGIGVLLDRAKQNVKEFQNVGALLTLFLSQDDTTWKGEEGAEFPLSGSASWLTEENVTRHLDKFVSAEGLATFLSEGSEVASLLQLCGVTKTIDATVLPTLSAPELARLKECIARYSTAAGGAGEDMTALLLIGGGSPLTASLILYLQYVAEVCTISHTTQRHNAKEAEETKETKETKEADVVTPAPPSTAPKKASVTTERAPEVVPVAAVEAAVEDAPIEEAPRAAVESSPAAPPKAVGGGGGGGPREGREAWMCESSGVRLALVPGDLAFLQGTWVVQSGRNPVSVEGTTVRFYVSGGRWGSEWPVVSDATGVHLLGARLNAVTSCTNILRWEDGDVWYKADAQQLSLAQELHGRTSLAGMTPAPPSERGRPNTAPLVGRGGRALVRSSYQAPTRCDDLAWTAEEYSNEHVAAQVKCFGDDKVREIFDGYVVDSSLSENGKKNEPTKKPISPLSYHNILMVHEICSGNGKPSNKQLNTLRRLDTKRI